MGLLCDCVVYLKNSICDTFKSIREAGYDMLLPKLDKKVSYKGEKKANESFLTRNGVQPLVDGKMDFPLDPVSSLPIYERAVEAAANGTVPGATLAASNSTFTGEERECNHIGSVEPDQSDTARSTGKVDPHFPGWTKS